MVKLPILQKLLNRGKKKDELVVIYNSCYSGTNFVLMVKKIDEDRIEMISQVKSIFSAGMKSDYPLEVVLKDLKNEGIIVRECSLLERAVFILFEEEL